MLKKITIILLSTSLCVAEPVVTEKIQDEGVSVGKVILWCGIGTGVVVAGVVYAPVLLPAGAIASAQGAIATAGANIAAGAVAAKGAVVAAGPVAAKINISIAAARIGRKIAYSTPQEKLNAMVQEEIAELAKAKEEFENCLKKNKDTQQNVALGIPSACEEVAMAFLLHGGV
jgi:hypothetical protein